MDNFALVASKFSVVVAAPASYEILSRRRSAHSSLPSLPARRGRRIGGGGRPHVLIFFALKTGSIDRAPSNGGRGKFKAQVFASASSSSNSDMTISGAMAPLPVPSSPTSMYRFALQQAFKTMMGQAAPQGGQFNNPSFGPGSPFPFPATTSSSPTASTTSPARVSTQQSVTLDVPATKVESTSQSEVGDETQLEDENPKKFAFVDVSPEELVQNDPSNLKESTKASPAETQPVNEIPPNGTVKQDGSASNEQTQSRMMQNPQFRQQMQDMLYDLNPDLCMHGMHSAHGMGSASGLRNYLNEQIGLTPEEVISKIMANPDVAMAFQNPKVKAAIFDCSQNPLSIAKYQNDKELGCMFESMLMQYGLYADFTGKSFGRSSAPRHQKPFISRSVSSPSPHIVVYAFWLSAGRRTLLTMAIFQPNLFLLLPLVSVLAMAPDLATGDNAAHLHFYMHDTLSGSTPSAVRVVRVSNATVLGFGDVVVTDDPLTEGPDLRSAPVGRSQGLYSMVSQGTGDAALLLGLNLVFTEGSRNGSTLAVLGWDAVYLPVRELPVVGGSGVFRLARGYALIKTYSLNTTTGDAILEWD
ncbi:Proteasome complex subunit Rpn13 ubiquitin receptor, partial [Musa troglodytarum]